MNSTEKTCPLCSAPWDKDIGLGISGTTPGDRYVCGSLFIKPQKAVSITKMCQYAASLLADLRSANEERIRLDAHASSSVRPREAV